MVSVVLPVYNSESTIERAITSVLNQTYADLELIVVDDGSTDKTKEIIQTIDDVRLRYIYQNNSGACEARNKGILAAKGEYIAFQDSDDAWRANKLEVQLRALQNQHADIVFCKGKKHGYSIEEEFPQIEKGFVQTKRLIEHSLVSTQTILAKTSVFEDELFDVEMPRLQDYDLVIRLAKKYQFYFCDEVLVDLYLQSDSITLNIPKSIKAYERIIEKYQELWIDYPAVEARYLNTLGMFYVKEGKPKAILFKHAFDKTHHWTYFVKYLLIKTGMSGLLKRK